MRGQDSAIRLQQPRTYRLLRRFGHISSNLRNYPLGVVGGVAVIVFVLVGMFAPLVAPHDPFQASRASLHAPSQEYWLGTDQLGRDVLSRIIYGARVSLIIGLAAAVGGSTTGAVLGIIGTYLGPKADNIIQRLMDVLMAFPSLLLALAMAAVLGPSLANVTIAIALPIVPRASRIVRSVALQVKVSDFVTAAQAIGASNKRIMVRHIAPNCMSIYLVITTSFLGGAVLAEASLSYLGVGVQAPFPSWGGMLAGDAARFFFAAPWLAIVPGIAISLVVLGFNLFGDALRDAWDPRLRGAGAGARRALRG